MKALFLILTMAVNSQAGSTDLPCDQGASEAWAAAKLADPKATLDRIDDVCRIRWASGNPVFTGAASQKIALMDELAAIEIKLDDGTADMANLRRWAKIMMKLKGLARRP